MDEYKVEVFIANDEDENIVLSNLDEKEMEQWKKDMEARALGEYYNKKIKIEQIIWFQKAVML